MSDNMKSFAKDFYEICNSLEQQNKIFVIYDNSYEIQRYSYEDSLNICQRYIALFHRCNLKEGDSLVSLLPNSPEAIFCFFATLLCGVNYAPLPCSVTNREFINWISIIKPKLIIKKQGIADYKTDINVLECNCDGDFSWLDEEKEKYISNISSNIYLMTSGTTGEPKAMTIDSDSLWNSGKEFTKFYSIDNSKVRFWNYLPMSYLGGLFNLALIPLCCKGSFVVSEPFSGKTMLNYWNFVKKHEINALWFVPTIVQGLLKLSLLFSKNYVEEISKKIKIAFLGTAPISLKLKQDFEKRFNLILYENFALSETTFLTAEINENLKQREQSSVGGKLPYVKIKIVPIDGIDNIGSIWVKTPFLFKGYLSKDGKTEIKTDSEGYFDTKDLGYFNKDGLLVLRGRDRDIIKKGGLFVSLTEIENATKDLSNIEEVAALPIEHNFYGESYILCVKFVNNTNSQKNIDDLYLWLLNNFVSYKLPEKIITIDDFPKTSSGKIQKRKILSMIDEIKSDKKI